MPYSTNKATWFTVVRTLVSGITWDNISTCDCAVVVVCFNDTGGGSIFVGWMVESVTHGPYFDAGLHLCYHKFVVTFVCRLFYRPLYVPDIIITL